MAKQPTVFISYNSNSDLEQTLAMRLHTIGAVHGLNMHLPDRFNSDNIISPETQSRINFSDYYILFSTNKQLSKAALNEIQYAFQKYNDKSRIIIIYDAAKGKNMKGTDNCTELFFDRKKYSMEQFISQVMGIITNHHTSYSKKQSDAVGGLVLAGLGLLLLGAVFSGKK
jgi:hypothetical protein